MYKNIFQVPDGAEVNTEIDRTRKFMEDNGIMINKRTGETNIDIAELCSTLKDSGKRAKDNFYGYALCNDWRYFLTLTFDPKKIDRNNEDILKYVWQLFRQKLQYINKYVKILCVPERHPTSGKIHFHALIGNIDLKPHLTTAIDLKSNKALRSKFGDTIYNISLWEYGFSTCIDLTEQGYNRDRIANYMIGYCTKENDIIGYNKKRYYRTRNLDFKEKQVSYVSESEFQDSLTIAHKVKKETDKYIIYEIDNKNKSILEGKK